ncbi:MAG: hypothetical protein ABI707_10175 [Ferruginibacter sp.]
MIKLTLITLLTFCFLPAYPQHDFFVFKKKKETIASFRKDSYIAFQGKNRQWFTGYITKIENDSFYIKPMVVHYNLGSNDTVYYNIQQFTFEDVYAMPKKGIQVDYINGRFQITTSGGHVHWYWIKSGWIFLVGSVGYATLNVANGLIKNNFSSSGSKFGIAAAVFLLGGLLHYTYKPTLRLGKKYYLQTH